MRIENVPGRLKALRTARKWSLDRTAAATGVSKAMLGQIERGESSPTIATLWKIAVGFGAPFSALFEPGRVSEAAAAPAAEPDLSGMQVQTVIPFAEDTGIEVFAITLEAGSRLLREPHQAGVIEHVIVTGGEMELLLEGDWRVLKTGEGIRFPADRAHGYAAPDEPAQFHNIIYYP